GGDGSAGAVAPADGGLGVGGDRRGASAAARARPLLRTLARACAPAADRSRSAAPALRLRPRSQPCLGGEPVLARTLRRAGRLVGSPDGEAEDRPRLRVVHFVSRAPRRRDSKTRRRSPLS